MVQNKGLVVDDPAPENIRAQPDAENLYPGQTWGVQSYVDPMELHGLKKSASFIGRFDVNDATWLEIFLHLFPTERLRNMLIVETNKKLTMPIGFGELIRHFGCWVLIASVGGEHKKEDNWYCKRVQ